MQRLEKSPPLHIFREKIKMTNLLSKQDAKYEGWTPTFFVASPVFASKDVWTNILGTMFPRKLFSSNSYFDGPSVDLN